MAKMGAGSFESELLVLVGNDKRATSARLTRWRRDAYYYIGRAPRITEFQSTTDISINPGTTSSTLPTNLRAITGIREIRPSRHPVYLTNRTQIDSRTFGAGDVMDAARQDRTIYWGNSVSTGRAFRIYYQVVPTLPSGTTVHGYAEDWEDAHLQRAVYIAMRDLYGEERAATRKALFDETLRGKGYDPTRFERATSVEEIESRSRSVTLHLRTQ